MPGLSNYFKCRGKVQSPLSVSLTLKPEPSGWSCKVLLLAGVETWPPFYISSASAFCCWSFPSLPKLFFNYFSQVRNLVVWVIPWDCQSLIPFINRHFPKHFISLNTGFRPIIFLGAHFLLKLYNWYFFLSSLLLLITDLQKSDH